MIIARPLLGFGRQLSRCVHGAVLLSHGWSAMARLDPALRCRYLPPKPAGVRLGGRTVGIAAQSVGRCERSRIPGDERIADYRALTDVELRPVGAAARAVHRRG